MAGVIGRIRFDYEAVHATETIDDEVIRPFIPHIEQQFLPYTLQSALLLQLERCLVAFGRVVDDARGLAAKWARRFGATHDQAIQAWLVRYFQLVFNPQAIAVKIEL